MTRERCPLKSRRLGRLDAAGLAAAIFLLMVCLPVNLGAEPATADIARDVAALSDRVGAIERFEQLVLGLLGVSVLGLPALWWRLGKRIATMADEKISSLLESRRGALLTIVDEHDSELKLRRQSRIVIFSETLDLEVVLRQHGFFRVVSRRSGSEVDDLSQVAAVVLDLRSLGEDQARTLMQRHGLEYALAYTTSRADLPNATFANSPITLFARLCELLKFQAAREKG